MSRLAIVVVVIAALAGLLVYSQYRTQPRVVSGLIEADEIRLGSRVGGRVAEVLAQEGQAVKPGDLLVRLEPFDLDQRRAQAAAQLQAAQADRDRLTAGFRPEEIAQAQARVERLEALVKKLKDGPREEEIKASQSRLKLANAQWERATQDYERDNKLFEARSGIISKEALDRRVEELRVTLANREVREQELLLLQKGTRAEDIAEAAAQLKEAQQALALVQNGYRAEDIAAAEAAVAAAQAAVAAIDEQRKELSIRAPVAGTVEALELQPGDLVAAGAPVLSLLDESHMWLRAFVPESQLRFSLNAAVDVSVDSYPGEKFQGRIVFVARQAEFTPNNVQTIEERSKQVVRIKVVLEDGRGRLRPGMSADLRLP